MYSLLYIVVSATSSRINFYSDSKKLKQQYKYIIDTQTLSDLSPEKIKKFIKLILKILSE